MQRINEFQIYELANTVHPLTTIKNELRYSEVWFEWMNAKTAIAALFQQRALEVCYGPANELYMALGAVVPDDFDQAVAKIHQDKDVEEPPIGYGIYTIREAAKKFETVFAAELSNSDTYWISPKGSHKTSVLMRAARTEFPMDVQRQIPDEALIDFDEAGKCLLFDNSTAAGFHLVRATEAVIRKYYETVVGTSPPKKFRNWGAYIKRLRDKGANPKVTGFLDHIREHYRNPVLHPEVTLTANDAQVLFGVCVSAIVMMSVEIAASPGAVLPFPVAGSLVAGGTI